MYLHPVLRGVSFWGATSRSGRPAGPGLDAVHKTRCVCDGAESGQGQGRNPDSPGGSLASFLTAAAAHVESTMDGV